MTPVELHQLCKRITYKPSFRMEVEQNRDVVYVRLSMRVMDALNFDKTIDLTFAQALTTHQLEEMPEGVILGILKNWIKEMEIHECREFLRLDGHHMEDPHPELAEDDKEAA